MDYGLLVSLLTGLVLAAPWPAGVQLNYPKLGIKLAILVVLGGLLGVGNGRQRRTGEAVPRPLFCGVGALAFSAAALAVVW
jgi:hypothetical protein